MGEGHAVILNAAGVGFVLNQRFPSPEGGSACLRAVWGSGGGGGREGETVSRGGGAVAPALRARPQLADRGTVGRYTSQGFFPPRTKCSWALTG